MSGAPTMFVAMALLVAAALFAALAARRTLARERRAWTERSDADGRLIESLSDLVRAMTANAAAQCRRADAAMVVVRAQEETIGRLGERIRLIEGRPGPGATHPLH